MGSAARAARKRKGFSITEAAQKLGIPAGYLSEIETGKKQVSADRAAQIARLYDVTESDIFYLDATRFMKLRVRNTPHRGWSGWR